MLKKIGLVSGDWFLVPFLPTKHLDDFEHLISVSLDFLIYKFRGKRYVPNGLVIICVKVVVFKGLDKFIMILRCYGSFYLRPTLNFPKIEINS